MITKRLGELLIEQGLITQEQLDEALQLQTSFPDQTIGQLLSRLGYIGEGDLSLVLDQKQKRPKLSEILLKRGAITPQQLTQARELSRQHDIPLEQALRKLRLVDDEQLAQALAVQFDLPCVRSDDDRPVNRANGNAPNLFLSALETSKTSDCWAIRVSRLVMAAVRCSCAWGRLGQVGAGLGQGF